MMSVKSKRSGFSLGVAAAVAAVVLVCGTGASAGTGGFSSVRAACSKATAVQLDRRLGLPVFSPNPVAAVLCGAFTGPGSQAMVIQLSSGGSIPIEGWGVFRQVGGSWQLVMVSHTAEYYPLTAAGSDLRETVPVFRKGDPLCCASGGTKARVWHWNGATLKAGPWHQVTQGFVRADFYSPLPGHFSCEMGDDLGNPSPAGRVLCQSINPDQLVSMSVDGRLTICRHVGCAGNAGEGTVFRRLGYGKQVTVGRFRCRSERAGVTCTVIKSRKGFLINRAGITPVRQ